MRLEEGVLVHMGVKWLGKTSELKAMVMFNTKTLVYSFIFRNCGRREKESLILVDLARNRSTSGQCQCYFALLTPCLGLFKIFLAFVFLFLQDVAQVGLSFLVFFPRLSFNSQI